MEKIICSLEGYDSILNSNRPNGFSRTWYLEELGEIKYPLMWGDWNIFKNINNKTGLVQGEEVKNINCPLYGCEMLDYRNMDQVGNNPHIYVINVYHPFFFETSRNIGFSISNIQMAHIFCFNSKMRDVKSANLFLVTIRSLSIFFSLL